MGGCSEWAQREGVSGAASGAAQCAQLAVPVTHSCHREAHRCFTSPPPLRLPLPLPLPCPPSSPYFSLPRHATLCLRAAMAEALRLAADGAVPGAACTDTDMGADADADDSDADAERTRLAAVGTLACSGGAAVRQGWLSDRHVIVVALGTLTLGCLDRCRSGTSVWCGAVRCRARGWTCWQCF